MLTTDSAALTSQTYSQSLTLLYEMLGKCCRASGTCLRVTLLRRYRYANTSRLRHKTLCRRWILLIIR
ncbi:hypothetical protein [uncultured Nostoc sp.]|uniref:hypothetical protein n=1 Tax=uncultured Nostoc sp. TaxID=340711 RepID=UPI0035C965FD